MYRRTVLPGRGYSHDWSTNKTGLQYSIEYPLGGWSYHLYIRERTVLLLDLVRVHRSVAELPAALYFPSPVIFPVILSEIDWDRDWRLNSVASRRRSVPTLSRSRLSCWSTSACTRRACTHSHVNSAGWEVSGVPREVSR